VRLGRFGFCCYSARCRLCFYLNLWLVAMRKRIYRRLGPSRTADVISRQGEADGMPQGGCKVVTVCSLSRLSAWAMGAYFAAHPALRTLRVSLQARLDRREYELFPRVMSGDPFVPELLNHNLTCFFLYTRPSLTLAFNIPRASHSTEYTLSF
jgi:hypothetical protein